MYAVGLEPRIGVSSLGAQEHFTHPLPVSPEISAVLGSIFDHTSDVPPRAADAFLVTNRDCGQLDGFDVLTPSGTGVVAMTYAGNPAYAATVVNPQPNLVGRTMRAVTDGFEFERVRDVRLGGPAAYLDHLADVLGFLRGEDIPVTRVGDAPALTNRLDQNVPNPFNPSTRIDYTIARRGRVRVDVFDVAGRRVRTLVDTVQSPKVEGYSVVWEGTDWRGQPVASGVYFYRIQSPGYTATRKMLVLK
jgi:hypothetical protein